MRLLPLILILSACSAAPEEQRETDPAVAEALADPIMADPQLALQGEDGASLSVPGGAMPSLPVNAPTLGDIAKSLRSDPAFMSCNSAIDYSYQWMARTPKSLAPPKEAMTIEAGGSDAKGCALRIIRYGSTQDIADIKATYAELARRDGYMVTDQNGVVIATRQKDGAALRLSTTRVPNGTVFELIVNRGQ